MRGRDVQIGGRYLVKVSGSLVPVRVTRESTYGGWDAVNETTGRTIRVRSPQRFRPLLERPAPTTPPLHEEVPPVTAQQRDEVRLARDADARRRLAEDDDPIIRNPKEKTMTETDATPGGPELEKELMAAAKKAVKGLERLDAASGSYFRLKLGTTTLAYVNASKKGLILNLATPTDKVPAGVVVKPGPNEARPVKFRVGSSSDVEVAATLLGIAADSSKEEPAPAKPAARSSSKKPAAAEEVAAA